MAIKQKDSDNVTPFQKPESRNDKNRCQWHSGEKQCLMFGTISPEIGANARYYCTWHFFARQDPRWSEDYQQFLDWRVNIITNYRQTQWHENPEEIWRKLHGTNEAAA